jgi:hypothetical protein
MLGRARGDRYSTAVNSAAILKKQIFSALSSELIGNVLPNKLCPANMLPSLT